MDMLRKFFGQPLPASRDSVTFDASPYDFQGDQDGARVWFLPGGGIVNLHFFPLKPDLPRHATSVGQLKDSYAPHAEGHSGKLQVVECKVVPLDGVQSIWLIIKNSTNRRV
jgi:hypothetical protein